MQQPVSTTPADSSPGAATSTQGNSTDVVAPAVSPPTSPLQLRMTREVLQQIREAIGSRPAEHGGILGGSREDGVVRHFYFDDSAQRTGASYSPDHQTVNRLFKQQWGPAGIKLLGVVHSHPAGCSRPSAGDEHYATRILAKIPELDGLLLPIVQTQPDTGAFQIFPFVARRNGKGIRVEELALVIEQEAESAHPFRDVPCVDQPAVDRDDSSAGAAQPAEAPPSAPEEQIGRSSQSPATQVDLSETFRRVQTSYDLRLLARARVVIVGTGGAAAFVEDLARAGVGEFVLIDPDTVSESNIATQQVYRRDIGRPKVECLAERIQDINPSAVVVCRQMPIHELDDAEFTRLACAPLGSKLPLVSLLCGLSDSFDAQVRVNSLALHLGLPSLCAQVYKEGRGAEITFTHPGTTVACHRCMLASRYRAYLEEDFHNNVTSDGTPIFATTRLNALKGFIALAILHEGTDHPRWGRVLERIGHRNLVQIRMDPDIAQSLGIRVFDRVFGPADTDRILFDDVVWLPQTPDRFELNGRPTCPDCGGTGDLRDARGTFNDTRILRH